MNQVIELNAYAHRTEAFDYSAYNRRAEARFRLMRQCMRVLTAVDVCVTMMIGVGFLACVGLVFTML